MREMRFCRLEKEELPAALRLFERVFGAPEEGRLSLFAPLARVMGLWEGKALLSMLTVFPAELRCKGGRLSAAYLYAVATRPEREGEGLCTELLHKTHAYLAGEGCHAAVLLPSSEKNRRFYAGRGYRLLSSMAFGRFRDEGGEALPAAPCTAAEYRTLRERFLPAECLLWGGAGLSFMESWLSLYGGGFWRLGTKEHPLGAAALNREGGLRVRELLLKDPAQREKALCGLLRASGEESCTLSLSSPLLPEESPVPYAMWLPLGEERTAGEGFYTNLLMD